VQYSRSAEIIEFPLSVVRVPQSGALQVALENLGNALATQRAALAAWRRVLGELEIALAGLELSTRCYRVRLNGLSEGVAGLNREAQRLERWADSLEDLA
jgi:hypothetical protein